MAMSSVAEWETFADGESFKLARYRKLAADTAPLVSIVTPLRSSDPPCRDYVYKLVKVRRMHGAVARRDNRVEVHGPHPVNLPVVAPCPIGPAPLTDTRA